MELVKVLIVLISLLFLLRAYILARLLLSLVSIYLIFYLCLMALKELYNYVRDIYLSKYFQYILEVDLQESLKLYRQIELLYLILKEIRDK